VYLCHPGGRECEAENAVSERIGMKQGTRISCDCVFLCLRACVFVRVCVSCACVCVCVCVCERECHVCLRACFSSAYLCMRVSNLFPCGTAPNSHGRRCRSENERSLRRVTRDLRAQSHFYLKILRHDARRKWTDPSRGEGKHLRLSIVCWSDGSAP
jgi:hypothetical protein